jgi:hypothetical protein
MSSAKRSPEFGIYRREGSWRVDCRGREPKGSKRSRLLCIYPAPPKHNGSGDVNIAANFSCVIPAAP